MLLTLHYATSDSTICDQKFGSKLHFVWNHTKVQFFLQMPNFAHKISERRMWYPLREERFVIAPIWPPLSNTFRGLCPLCSQTCSHNTFKPVALAALSVKNSHCVSYVWLHRQTSKMLVCMTSAFNSSVHIIMQPSTMRSHHVPTSVRPSVCPYMFCVLVTGQRNARSTHLSSCKKESKDVASMRQDEAIASSCFLVPTAWL